MGIIQKLVRSAGDIRRLIRATRYSIAGLRTAISEESAFRQEVLLFVILAPLGAWLGQNAVERALLLGSLLLVLVVELLNSAVEAIIDRIGIERSELSGRAKDLGSAAVFLSLAQVLLVWGLILGQRLVAG